MSYISERRQEEKDRRRIEILDAAEALYSEQGWDAVTMDQIARRARLSRALLYVYFRDKADVHLALVERSLDVLRERFEAAIQGKATGLDELQAIGRAYLAFSHESPHHYDACSRYQAKHDVQGEVEPNEQACRDAGHRVHEVLVASINRGIADGSVRDDLGDPFMTALALWAFTHGLNQIAASKGGQIEAEGVPLQAFVDHAFALVLNSLRR
jgi:AcrR family transcriptional regulator